MSTESTDDPAAPDAKPGVTVPESRLNKDQSSTKPDDPSPIDKAAETGEEMLDVMQGMMGASTKMMQSFIDMRLNYLKVMRTMTEDPMNAMKAMNKSLQEMADRAKKD